jgi:hypothetical protein
MPTRPRNIAVSVTLRVLVALGLVFVPQLAYATPGVLPQPVQEEEEKEQEQKRAEGSRHVAGPLPRNPRSPLARSNDLPDSTCVRASSDAGLGRAATVDHFRNGLGTPPRC